MYQENANLNQYVYDKESMPSSCACVVCCSIRKTTSTTTTQSQLLLQQTRADYLH